MRPSHLAAVALLVAAVLPRVPAQGTVTLPILPGSGGQSLPIPFGPPVGWSAAGSSVDITVKRSPSHPARLVNLSLRALAGGSAGSLVAGAVISGTGNLPMLARAVGPGLRQFGVTNNLPDPALELFRGSTSAAKTAAFAPDLNAVSAYLGAFPLLAASGAQAGDAALLGQAATGTLTATCTSSSNASGVALLEFYDASGSAAASTARFSNLSSRSYVGTGNGIVVLGFVIEGDGQLPLLLRGVGPSLAQFNVADVLADPAIALYSGSTRIAANDNWRSGGIDSATALQNAGRAIGAFDLASDNDAALLVSLPAGSYTLLVYGAGGQTGTALAEIYEAPASVRFDIAGIINGAGLDLYRQVALGGAGNLAVSPYSIQTALAMAYAGAAGVTRTEMAAVLGFPDDDAALQSGLAGIRTSLDALASQSVALAQSRSTASLPVAPLEWHAANQAFAQQNLPFRDTFLAAMRDGFAAPLQLEDFAHNLERARLAINNWVANQTQQKILNLVPPGGIDVATSLVLVNAIYLKAAWDSPFLANNTSPQPFHPTPEITSNLPTMHQTGSFGYSAEDGMTIVTLDYLGQGLQFVIVLPDQGQTPEAAAARITPGHFARWAKLDDTARTSVDLYLPKFSIQGTTVDLTNALQRLGMVTAFDPPWGRANFDGILPLSEQYYTWISAVFHQTYVVVNETGTEAAAATAVGLATVATSINVAVRPPIVLRVDRPFLFAIQHRASGACLFIGKVSNPQ